MRSSHRREHDPNLRHAEEWEKGNLEFWRSITVVEALPPEPAQTAMRRIHTDPIKPKPREEPEIIAVWFPAPWESFYCPKDLVPVSLGEVAGEAVLGGLEG